MRSKLLLDRPWLIAGMIFALLVGLLGAAWHELQARANQRARADLGTHSQHIRSELQRYFEARTVAIESMRLFFENQIEVTRAGFEGFSAELFDALSDASGVYFIDSDLTVRWAHPPRARAPSLGKPLSQLEGHEFMPEEISTRRTAVVSGFHFRGDGTIVAVVAAPIFKGERFLGLAWGVFNVQETLRPLTRLAGYSYASLRDENDRWLSGDRGPPPRSAFLTRFVAGGQELRLTVSPDPGVLSPGMLLFGVTGVAGSFLLALLVYVLITHHIEIERRVSNRTVALEEAVKQRNLLFSMVAHDIRAPLMTIAGFAELTAMRLGEDKPEALRSYLDRLLSNVRRVTDLVEDLVASEKARLSSELPQAEPLDIGALAGEVAANWRPLLDSSRVRLAVSLPASPLTVKTDRDKLRRILDNLMSNAVRVTEEGEIRLAVSAPAPERVVVEVGDTGPGLHPSLRELLRGPLEQLAREAGLGLYIVRTFSEIIGARLSVSSSGQGTSFEIELPRGT